MTTRVIATLRKPAPGAHSEPVDALDLPAGVPGPRQVLVGDEETLARIGGGGLTAEGLRWNVVLQGLNLDAHARSGQVLALGDGARIRLTHRCETCRTLRDVADAPTLKALAGHRGWLGVAVSPGTVAPGDAAQLLPGRPYPTVPDTVADRFAWVAAQIPPGHVMTYAAMLAALGAPRGYTRVLPTYARKIGSTDRVVSARTAAERGLPLWTGEGLYVQAGAAPAV